MSCHYVLREYKDFLDDYSHTEQKHNFNVASKKLAKYNGLNFKLCNFLNRLDNYTDKDEEEKLIKKIQTKYGTEEKVVLGAGANGILQNIINIFVTSKKDNIVTPYHTFMQAFYAVNVKNAQTRFAKMNNDFSVNFDNIFHSVDENTKLIFLCNPNNPTNLYECNDKILDLARKVKCPVVVSEASIAFSQERSLLEQKKLPENIVVLRSFSKEYGLSGIRLGYAVMSDKIFDIYTRNTPTHSVSLVSVKIANMAFDSKSVKKNVEKIVKERQFLSAELSKMGFDVLDSKSNAIMIVTPFEPNFLKRLEERKISFVKIVGEEGQMFIRIAVNSHKENKFLIDAFKGVKNENISGN